MASPTTIHARHQEVFAELVLPELPVLRRVAGSICSQPADAEDLVQETLLRAYRSIDTFDGAKPRAWLLTILRNTSLNLRRRRRPHLLDDPDTVQELNAMEGAFSPSPEEIIMAHHVDAVVGTAFGALPQQQREVVTLVDMGGLTCAEAADFLHIPIGTVMSRLHRARRALRCRLVDG